MATACGCGHAAPAFATREMASAAYCWEAAPCGSIMEAKSLYCFQDQPCDAVKILGTQMTQATDIPVEALQPISLLSSNFRQWRLIEAAKFISYCCRAARATIHFCGCSFHHIREESFSLDRVQMFVLSLACYLSFEVRSSALLFEEVVALLS